MTLSTRTARLPVHAINQEFDTMLAHLFHAPVVRPQPAAGPYPVDVREDADRVYVEADLPGFAKDEVEVTLEDHVLTLVAAHKPAPADAPAKAGYLLHERQDRSVRRSFKLPPTVGDQHVQATLANGVLTVTLAKREETKPRKIAVV